MSKREFTFGQDPIPEKKRWSLEASAGTGKTWTIQQLVTYFLTDPTIRPSEIVVVTFTRAAAAELRSRIRSAVATAAYPTPDSDQKVLYEEGKQETLRVALSNIAQLRATTIHRFTQQSLAALGFPIGELSDESGSENFFKASINDVLRSLNDSRLAELGDEEKSISTKVLQALKELAANPGGMLIASKPTDATEALIQLIEEVRASVERRKQLLGIAGFDDLLVKFREEIEDPKNLAKIASTIKVLLIDEFQDTDGIQWEIFDKIANFEGVKPFVTVGDPKQAIYGFRGGDVQVYREAVPEDALTLQSNYRSSQQLLDGSNTFFAGQAFGSEQPFTINDKYEVPAARIEYQEVHAAGKVSAFPMSPSWEFREIQGGDADEIKRNIVTDVATYISNAVGRDEIPHQSVPNGEVDGTRLVSFSDICILVNANALGRQLAKGLSRAGIPATMLGGANVFTSDAAQQWTYLIEALAEPSSPSSARLLAFSWFGGESQHTIADERDNEQWLAGWNEKLSIWSESFFSQRKSFFDDVMDQSGVRGFLIRQDGAERNLTDLRHVAEILASRVNDTFQLLLEFLREASPDSDGESTDNPDFGGTEWSRRIDRDTSAVKIMTIHRSKGLQFPIVLIPYLATKPSGDSVKAYRAKDGGRPLTLVDITVTGSGRNATTGSRVKQSLNTAENLRKGYVALTRAEFRNVLWHWTSTNSNKPLLKTPEELRALASDFPDLFTNTVTPVTRKALLTNGLRVDRSLNLQRCEFTRILGSSAERHSFTSISDRLSLSRRNSDTQADEQMQRPSDVDVEPESSDGELSGIIDFADVKSSKYIGVAVHSVLQYVDVQGLSGSDRREVIAQHLDQAATASGLHLNEHESDQLVTLIDRSLKSCLGAIAENQHLEDFTDDNRLPELGFDFPISGSGEGEEVRLGRVSQLVELLRTHLADDPICRSWLRSVNLRDLDLTGMLTGSIDAVLGWKSGEAFRFLVVDYKTNKLTNEHKLENYDNIRLIEAMDEHHYQLQALIYLVALHRYLRSRISDYDYDTHVAGAGYLFLRGMREDLPGSGVISFTPPKALIEAMSDFFDGKINV